MPPVVIIGSGGHARVLIDCLRLAGREILFCTEIASQLHGQLVDGVLIKGPDELIQELDSAKVQLANGIGSIGEPIQRREVYENFSKLGFEFTLIIHPTATIAKSAKIGDGVQIMAGAVITAGATIDSNTIINTSATIDHHCEIGAHCHIAPRATLSGAVVVGKRTHIGTGANVIQMIHIGEGCVIGAGATVLSNLPDGTVAVGTPAKPICSSDKS